MRRMILIGLVAGLSAIVAALVTAPPSPAQIKAAKGRTYYVRQTVGDDANDGLSPKTAWQHISKLSKAMEAGDTAYVGPGLYRETIVIENSGTSENKLTFIADTTGQHTGDPPGVVMITGAEPVDASMFVPHSADGVYRARFTAFPVLGVVEMDGDQYRYEKVTIRKEYHIDKMPPVDIVAKYPSTYYYDERDRVLYIHTSDGKPPNTHEIELIRGLSGFGMSARFFVTIIGFTIRHVGDAAIGFWEGSGYCVAMNNTAYGNRQGIRVFFAQNIVAYGNTLFRNENAGMYFLKESNNATAIGNITYDNVKGIRFGSKSVNAVVIGNTVFDNQWGISLEQDSNDAVLLNNRVVNNRDSQLLLMATEYRSEGNCFENGRPEQSIAEYHQFSQRYKVLGDLLQARRLDFSSREGKCGPLPEKVDVRKLHAETKSYTERARKLLSEPR